MNETRTKIALRDAILPKLIGSKLKIINAEGSLRAGL